MLMHRGTRTDEPESVLYEVESVSLLETNNQSIAISQGTLSLTNYRLKFQTDQRKRLEIMFSNVFEVKLSRGVMDILLVKCFDMREVRFAYHHDNEGEESPMPQGEVDDRDMSNVSFFRNYWEPQTGESKQTSKTARLKKQISSRLDDKDSDRMGWSALT
eukprot:TRINITY_DN4866_c2_g1_i3.p2 TRINITY_DN4866_c2_g1~~TRINITY_DN4866_c2_g1_i3.p2  ORF type:complete len:160 (-),score=35.24 TRINITY_DN4866_c2_g1_i3:1108-1587(-)